ncbi:hypothetical protein NL676_027654 [Syzygium grande]|nr:hypothetical protein NL676_027654 [Syzygium grande]
MRPHMIGLYVQFLWDLVKKAFFWPYGGPKMAKQGGAGANAKGMEPLARSDFAAVVHGGPSDLACSRARVPSREKRDFATGRIDPRSCPHHRESREECEYLVSLAKPRISKSTVVDGSTGKSMDSGVRTSFGMFLNRGQDKIVRAIEKRIADFTHIPVEHGEGLQILQYGHGQKYDAHHDYFSDPFNTRNGGQRMATMLMYLSDVEEGGETVFPAAKANFSAVPWWNELSECGKQGLSVKPKMGNAVLFWSMKPDGSLDPASLHGACPVIKGTKWSAPKWMHVQEYKV